MLVACAANVVISIVSTCLYFRFLWTLQDYPAFATQLGALMQSCVSSCLLLALGRSDRPPHDEIRSWHWLELGGWFSLLNTLEIAAVDGLGSANGDLTPVLQQAVIPLTLGLSMLLLRRHYSWLHWGAATLVIAGIVASYAPISRDSHAPWGWVLLYIASRVPQSVANVRGERLLRLAPQATRATESPPTAERLAQPMLRPSSAPDPIRSSAALREVFRAGLWTSLVCLVLNVPSALLLRYASGQQAADLLDDYAHGAACLLGYNMSDAYAATSHHGAKYHSQCGQAAASAAAAFAVPGALFAISEFQVGECVPWPGGRRCLLRGPDRPTLHLTMHAGPCCAGAAGGGRIDVLSARRTRASDPDGGACGRAR